MVFICPWNVDSPAPDDENRGEPGNKSVSQSANRTGSNIHDEDPLSHLTPRAPGRADRFKLSDCCIGLTSKGIRISNPVVRSGAIAG